MGETIADLEQEFAAVKAELAPLEEKCAALRVRWRTAMLRLTYARQALVAQAPAQVSGVVRSTKGRISLLLSPADLAAVEGTALSFLAKDVTRMPGTDEVLCRVPAEAFALFQGAIAPGESMQTFIRRLLAA